MNETSLDCDCCGDVGAYSDDQGFFADGQPLICGCPGQVSCDAESEPYVSIDNATACVACGLRESLAALHVDYDAVLAAHAKTVDELLARVMRDEKRARDAEAERDQLREDGITGETQNRIRDAIEVFTRVRVPNVQIDGSGCDSGDPVDLTLAEIRQGLIALDDALFDSERHLDRARGWARRWKAVAKVLWERLDVTGPWR